jgi:Fe-S cluster assembly protein SufD
MGQTFSNIKYVGVAMNGSTLVFDTTGKIEKGMAKAKCSQLSRGVVMDNESQITAKPILLIDEYDCFANHGASIGKMSDEDLFYLMSRGLTKKEAFLLIIEGIVRPFINAILKEELRVQMKKKIF